MAGAIYLGARKVGGAEYVAPTNYIKMTATITMTPSGIGYTWAIDAVGSGWDVSRLAIDPPILYVRTPGVEYNIVECVWDEGINYLEGTCSYGTFYLFTPDNPRVVSDSATPALTGNCIRISNASGDGTILELSPDFTWSYGNKPYLVGPDYLKIGDDTAYWYEENNGGYITLWYYCNNSNTPFFVFDSVGSVSSVLDVLTVGAEYYYAN